MEGHCSTGQSPQWAVVPMEEEEEEEKKKNKKKIHSRTLNQMHYIRQTLTLHQCTRVYYSCISSLFQ